MNQNVAVTQLRLDFLLADAIMVEPEVDSDDSALSPGLGCLIKN